MIVTGANTDPYQPLLKEHRHPFSLITKASLILRDLDLLAEMSAGQLCSVAVSVTTLDNGLKRKLEPRTASWKSRLKTIEALSKAGTPVTLMVAPVIPFINDSEIRNILERGKEAGAIAANMIYLKLPREVSPLVQEWLELHYPDKAAHVMSLVRQSRGGKDYDSRFFLPNDRGGRDCGNYSTTIQHRRQKVLAAIPTSIQTRLQPISPRF
ncbi:MAG: DNA repair photolyase [Patiriisocius sp.]